MRRRLASWFMIGVAFCGGPPAAAAASDPAGVREALLKAVTTMHRKYARHGGYVWNYSPDGMLRMGEAPAGDIAAWVQPPGTPTVGEAFLDAYEATGERRCMDAALEAAAALVKGQLDSGGWYYRIEFDPEKRKKICYRVDEGAAPKAGGPAGWETWRKRRNRTNQSMLDDDTSQAALRFLMRVDAALKQQDELIHEAVEYGLRMLMGTQYPVGAWSHNFDSFPEQPPPESVYPVKPASYPEDWPRKWPNAWDGCYHLNDNITPDCISTLLLAHEIYGRADVLGAARRGGEFLIRSQMPQPQPAWAQQYDKNMQPVWERKFEPPAVTGGESQAAMTVLMDVYQATRERRFLEPIAPALEYLRSSLLAGGGLARFYELKTNRPIYFDKEYRMTYDPGDVPDHYSFVVGSRLDKIERRYQAVRTGKPKESSGRPSADRVREIMQTANTEGIWLEPGVVRDSKGRKVKPEQGVVSMATFAKNVRAMSDFLRER